MSKPATYFKESVSVLKKGFAYMDFKEQANGKAYGWFSSAQQGREELVEQMQKCIEDVTDPTKNSINEKCARIRHAFATHMGNFMAHYYAITGNRGETKRILLDREYIRFGWEAMNAPGKRARIQNIAKYTQNTKPPRQRDIQS